jgi:hypothetical protein
MDPRLPKIPRAKREGLLDFKMIPIEITWKRPRDMKNTAAAIALGPNTVVITAGAKSNVRVGAAKWSTIGTIRDAAPIRLTVLTETIGSLAMRLEHVYSVAFRIKKRNKPADTRYLHRFTRQFSSRCFDLLHVFLDVVHLNGHSGSL